MFNNHLLQLAHKYPEKIKWDEIHLNSNLTEEFIEKHLDKIDPCFIYTSRISLEFILKHQAHPRLREHIWNYIWKNYNILCKNDSAMEFIQKHIKKVNWKELSNNQNITEKFIKKHFNEKWDFASLCYHTQLSIDFIIKFCFPHLNKNCKRIIRYELSSRKDLSDEYIHKYKNYLQWNHISCYHTLTIPFMNKYESYLIWDSDEFFNINYNRSLTLEIIEHPKYFSKWNWKTLSQDGHLDQKIIKKYHHKLDWSILRALSILILDDEMIQIIDLHKKELNWESLSFNHNLTLEFVKKYHYHLFVIYNEYVDLEILETDFNLNTIKDQLKRSLLFNKNITLEFIEKYKLSDLIDETPSFWGLDMNLNHVIQRKNLKKYSQALAAEIPQEINNRQIRKNKNLYECCVHEIKLNVRDTKLGTIISQI